MRHIESTLLRAGSAGLAAIAALALTACAAPKQEEVPFWAIGKPKAEAGAKLAPVPSFPGSRVGCWRFYLESTNR